MLRLRFLLHHTTARGLMHAIWRDLEREEEKIYGIAGTLRAESETGWDGRLGF